MKHVKRRLFLKMAAALGAELLVHPDILYAADPDESRKKALANYQFNFSSPYFTSKHATTPHAHRELKALIETYTKHKVYVTIHDGGSHGVGSSLANSVKFNKSQGALLSLSNLSPMVKEFDLINIPYWSAKNDEFMRLVKSKLWEQHVLSKTKRYNLKVLFHYLVGTRTATSTKLYGKIIKTPDDFKGLTFRVPGSKNLTTFYQSAGATPVPIAWKLCSRTARKGRFQALDPSVIGLYSGPEDLNNELGTISDIESVNDGWAAICNTDFLASMDAQTRTQFLDAIEAVSEQQGKSFTRCRQQCETEFMKLGTTIYTPTAAEKKALADAFGPDRPVWRPAITNLLGDNGLAVFDKLRDVARG